METPLPEVLTVNDREFKVHKLLGKGKGGYSYLVSDSRGEYVLKQIHLEPFDYYQFGDKIQTELNDYRRLKATKIPIPQMIDADVPKERILKEYIAGETAFELVRTDRMRDEYIEQVRAMCALLYPAKINIDYFPTNFIVRDGILYYIDFECNNYMDEWNFENWGIKYWSKTEEFMEHLRREQEKKAPQAKSGGKMKCPICGKEMRRGYIPNGGQPVQWIPEGDKPSVLSFTAAKNGVSLVNRYRPLKSNGYMAEAFYCPTCKIVIAPTEE